MKNAFLENMLVVVISLGGASTCAYLFNKDVYAKASGGDRSPAGVLADKQLTVKRKFSDRLVWDLIDSQDTLYWNDSIRTAENAKADITLDDGNKIVIGESSLVVLERNNDQLALNLKSGQLFVDNSKAVTTKKTQIKVNGRTLAQADGEKVALKFDQAKGEVMATSASADGTAKEIVIDKTGHVEEKVLPAVLKSPDTLSINYTDKGTSAVHFSWQTKKAAHRYLEVARDSSFKNLVNRSQPPLDTADLAMPVGSYFWRVRLNDGKEDVLSETRTFDVIAVKPPEILGPAQTQVLHKATEKASVDLAWNAVSEACKYLVEVAPDGDFKTGVMRFETSDTTIKVPDLKDGHYAWRVSALYGTTWKPSAPFQIEIAKIKPPPPPEMQYPARDFKVTLESFEKNHGLLFQWKSQAGARYHFALSRSEKLTDKDLVTSFDVDSGQALVRETVPPGIYYWGVAHKDEQDKWVYTEVRKLDVDPLFPLLGAPSILGPNDKESLDLMDNPRVMWSWRAVEGAKEYKFKLYKLTSGKIDLVADDTVQTLQKEKEDLPDGEYKWMVSSIDKYGRESKPVEHQFKVIHGKPLAATDFEMSEVQ